MSAANRSRGARAEVAVVNYLRDHGWPDARRYLAGDGRQPGDVDFHPLICLEVKDVAQSAWPTWCRQAAAESRPGMVPVVVRRTRCVPDAGRWECRYRGWDWFRATDQPAFGPYAPEHDVDGWPWFQVPFAEVAAALARLDGEDAS